MAAPSLYLSKGKSALTDSTIRLSTLLLSSESHIAVGASEVSLTAVSSVLRRQCQDVGKHAKSTNITEKLAISLISSSSR